MESKVKHTKNTKEEIKKPKTTTSINAPVCAICGKPATIETYDGWFCPKHFIDYFENKVFNTIKKYNLIKNNQRIAVATSGGKDSTTVLYLTNKYIKQNKLNSEVDAILIDEGIKGYRENTIKDMKNFCKQHNINYKIYSFKEKIGMTLDEMIKKLKNKNIIPCSICGVFRRYLLNKASRNYDIIVTGHNMDDEAQTILLNILKNNKPLMSRVGIKNGIKTSKKLTQRIKPLYFCKEKEVLTYTVLKKFGVSFNVCPYASLSFRGQIGSLLNKLEYNKKGTKLNIIKHFLDYEEELKSYSKNFEIKYCKICGEPSSTEICKACQIKIKLGLISLNDTITI